MRSVAEEQRLLERSRSLIDVPMLREVAHATLADLDLARFRRYMDNPSVIPTDVRARNHRPESHQLRAFRFASRTDHPTVLGVLVLSADPTLFVPGAYVQFRRVLTDDLTSETIAER